MVAVYAMLLAVAHGYQAVLMAPTEVLARQHALTLERLLGRQPGPPRPVDRRAGGQARAALLQLIAAGEIDLVVGTQAIIQEDVSFAKLGLVVIDEQHKFGVRQRATLKQAGPDPHYLVMTATPIPRTRHHDALRRSRRLDARATARRAGRRCNTYLAGEDQRAQVVGLLPQEAPRGAAGLRRYAAGRGIGHSSPGGQPRRNLRDAGQRRTGGLSAGADPRPHDARPKRTP